MTGGMVSTTIRFAAGLMALPNTLVTTTASVPLDDRDTCLRVRVALVAPGIAWVPNQYH